MLEDLEELEELKELKEPEELEELHGVPPDAWSGRPAPIRGLQIHTGPQNALQTLQETLHLPTNSMQLTPHLCTSGGEIKASRGTSFCFCLWSFSPQQLFLTGFRKKNKQTNMFSKRKLKRSSRPT